MSEWDEVVVKDIAAPNKHSMSTGPFGSAISSKYFVETGVPVIRGGNLSAEIGTKLSDDDLVFVTSEKAKEFERSIVRSGDIILEMPLRLPSLPEQRAIASVLSSLDDKIDLLHRQNKTLEAMVETLFRKWFVEEVKDDWEFVPLGDAVETTSGGTPSRVKMEYYENAQICWVKSKELTGSFVIDTEEHITDEGLRTSSAKLLPANSVLIALYGATVGEYAIISKEMTCNQAVCALKPNDDYPYTFLFSYVKNAKGDLVNMAVGSAQQNISQLLIRQLPLPKAKFRVAEFDQACVGSFEKMKLNVTQIRTLEKLRDNLLPKLMSGEVRVQYE